MLFQIFKDNRYPFHASLPEKYHAACVTKYAVNTNSRAVSFLRCRTVQYSKSYIPVATKVWNELSSEVVESMELQIFKVRANRFLVGLNADT